MSLLQQESREAAGESYTKGTSHVIIATVIAVVLVSAAVTIYVISGEKPPASTGEIIDVWAHPMHSETSGWDANGAVIPKESIDQVLLFTHVKLHNQGKLPLFLHQAFMNVTTADGTVNTIDVAPATDYLRAFQAYPELAPFRGNPLPTEPTVEPGQTIEGDIVASSRMSKEEWDSRKAVDYTFGFRYQPLLRVTPVGPITEK